MTGQDLRPLLEEIEARLGVRAKWEEWPGGWQDDIESALVDAVFSARAVYDTKRGKGIKSQVLRWRTARERTHFTLTALVEEIDARGIEEWSRSFGNRQLSPRRPLDAEGGPLKTATVREAAERLVDTGQIDDSASVTEPRLNLVRTTLRQVPGIGIATSDYFLMLLGWPGVKPDRMIHRFLRRAYGRDLGAAAAKTVVTEAAGRLKVTERDLDHAIWSYESGEARKAVGSPGSPTPTAPT